MTDYSPPTSLGPDGQPRCGWCGSVAEFFPYHDYEWGFPVADDQRLFEKTTAYAFMQAMGLINDHLEACVIREQVEQTRRKFMRPIN